MADVFISYARENKERMDLLNSALKQLGFTTWTDTADLPIGEDISVGVQQNIDQCQALVTLWSPSSRLSSWVRSEALYALENEKYFGGIIEGTSLPLPFNAINATDLSYWAGSHLHPGWERLVRDLAAKVGKQTAILATLEQCKRQEVSPPVTQLPLPFDPEEDSNPEPPQDERRYADVESLRTVASASRKSDLEFELIRMALEHELKQQAHAIVGEIGAQPGDPRVVATIAEALRVCPANGLIVVGPGEYRETLVIDKEVRIVGIGTASQRPKLIARGPGPCIQFMKSARIENLNIEMRGPPHAVHCAAGQPVILRCSITRYHDGSADKKASVWVSSSSNPIFIASNILAFGAPGIQFVGKSRATLVSCGIITSRGEGIVCRGRPMFEGCTIEATGKSALVVLGVGMPEFQNSTFVGRGEPVVQVKNNARPKIRSSRVTAIRQLAFEFEGSSAGQFDENIIEVESPSTPPVARPRRWWSRPTQPQATYIQFAKVAQTAQPMFRNNKSPVGVHMELPH